MLVATRLLVSAHSQFDEIVTSAGFMHAQLGMSNKEASGGRVYLMQGLLQYVGERYHTEK